jgi:Na+/proline symporter
VIAIYSALGGFRGSIYSDVLQASIRIIGNTFAVVAVWVVAFPTTCQTTYRGMAEENEP